MRLALGNLLLLALAIAVAFLLPANHETICSDAFFGTGVLGKAKFVDRKRSDQGVMLLLKEGAPHDLVLLTKAGFLLHKWKIAEHVVAAKLKPDGNVVVVTGKTGPAIEPSP